jgi:class 3 adenylate cyclase
MSNDPRLPIEVGAEWSLGSHSIQLSEEDQRVLESVARRLERERKSGSRAVIDWSAIQSALARAAQWIGRNGAAVLILGTLMSSALVAISAWDVLRIGRAGGILILVGFAFQLWGAWLSSRPWLAFSASFLSMAWWGILPRGTDSAEISQIVFVLSLLMLAFLWGGIVAFVAWTRRAWVMLRERSRISRMSRAEMIKRVAEIEAILKSSAQKSQSITRTPFLRRRGLLVFGSILAAINAVSIFTTRALDPEGGLVTGNMAGVSGSSLAIIISISLVAMLLSVAGPVIMASFRKSLGLWGIQSGISGVGIAALSPEVLGQWTTWVSYGANSLIVIAAAGAGKVALAHRRKRAAERGEPAALLPELMELSYRLRPVSQEAAVMVVDAVKSTMMKQGADTFSIEYSFGLYQELIARACAQAGGKVHSTAGDGAVASFPHPRQAAEAAQEIMRGLAAVNVKSRLSMPFHARIGVHWGSLAGSLDDIQFTEVIDIAAHAEKAAQTGQIVLTQAAASQLEPDECLSLGSVVDGQSMYGLKAAV